MLTTEGIFYSASNHLEQTFFHIYRDMKNIDSFSQFQERSLEPIEEKKGPCWDGYKQVGLKKKGNKMVPNCVPEKPKK